MNLFDYIPEANQDTNREDNDPITCITCSNKLVLIGSESGNINFYSFPNVAFVKSSRSLEHPTRLELNMNSE